MIFHQKCIIIMTYIIVRVDFETPLIMFSCKIIFFQ
eukprot:UN32526